MNVKKIQSLTMTLVFSLIIIISSCSGDRVQEKYQISSHPRILLAKGEEALIQKTISSDDAWKTIHTFILDECEKMIESPPVERKLIGRRLLDKSREALRRIYYLSYAYRMTGDDRYAARAENEMLAVSEFTDWNPSHFLDVAEMTMAVSIGYDWLYKELSQESRKTIREAIISKGLRPSLETENNSWVSGSNNWNQVCNAGMTFGALAVYDDEPELSEMIINRALGSINLPMEDYHPDGAYPEGYSYWGYGTTFNIMFLSAMEKISVIDTLISPGFLKTSGYLLNMVGPAGVPFNYSDAGSGGEMNPGMFWFANRLNDPSLLWSEKYFITNNYIPDDRLLPSVMIWGAGITMDKITPPEKKIWIGQGKNPVALMRSSWTDSNAIYLGIKSGSPSENHGHMDVGSFVMDANGERWAMDFGMQDYNSLETAGVDLWNRDQNSQRWEVFRYNNFVHNTLTVNNHLQKVEGKSKFISFSDSPLMINAVTDISSVYQDDLKKAVRGAAITGDKVIIRDEIETLGSKALIRWNLLTTAEVTIEGNNTAILTKNGKKLTIKVRHPDDIKMRTWSTEPPHEYDAANNGTIMVGFEVKVPADSKISITVLLLPDGATENLSAVPEELKDWPGQQLP
jgi:hypothetical protein